MKDIIKTAVYKVEYIKPMESVKLMDISLRSLTTDKPLSYDRSVKPDTQIHQILEATAET